MKPAQQWLEEASSFIAEGNKYEAVTCYNQALADILYHKGNALYELGDFYEANLCFDQCIALEIKYMPAYRGKFRVLMSEGRNNDTIEWCDKAIEVDPNYPFAYNSKANAQRAMGLEEDAVKNYEKAISLDPNWTFPYNGLGNVLTDLKRFDEAIQSYDHAIRLDPTDHFPLNGKATALTILKKYEEAEQVFNQLISIAPENALYLCNRGRLLSVLGKNKEAIEDFKRAQEAVYSVNIQLSPVHSEYVLKTLKPVMEFDEIQTDILNTLESAKGNPASQKIAENFKGLEAEQYKVFAQMFRDSDDNIPEQEQEQIIIALESLKERLVAVQTELRNIA